MTIRLLTIDRVPLVLCGVLSLGCLLLTVETSSAGTTPAISHRPESLLNQSPVPGRAPDASASPASRVDQVAAADPAQESTQAAEEKAPTGTATPEDAGESKPGADPVPKPARKPVAADAPDKASKLDENLLKSLDPETDGDNDAVDRLERAIAGMRQAQEKIDARNTGKATQDVQTQVLKDLEQLIEAIQNADPSNQPNLGQKQNKKQKSLKEQQRELQQQAKAAQSKPKAQEQSGKSDTGAQKAELAKDSSEKIQQQKTLEAELARRQQLSKDVWGHLPPALREKLLNVYSDKYLPKYEDLVRRYYEALAERNKQRDADR